MTEDIMEYAGRYQALRNNRRKEFNGIFLPLEILKEKETGIMNLSVSFSGTGFADTFISQQVSLYRIVKIKMKWLIVPSTVSKVLSKDDLLKNFGKYLETVNIDGEEFWVIRERNEKAIKALINEFNLNNSFREKYIHAYLPDSA